MTTNTPISSLNDSDPQETKEWLEALEAVIEHEGEERAHYLLETLIEKSPLGWRRYTLQRGDRLYQYHYHSKASAIHW
jgi:Pyruvate dehydrogenase complex, dehydrogenase (E1) component